MKTVKTIKRGLAISALGLLCCFYAQTADAAIKLTERCGECGGTGYVDVWWGKQQCKKCSGKGTVISWGGVAFAVASVGLWFSIFKNK